MLTKESILAAPDFRTKDIEVKEWSGSVRIRGLSSRERDEFEETLGVSQDMTNMRARLVGRALIDEDGKRLFTDREMDKLGDKSGEIIAMLFDEVRGLSGMTDEDLGVAEGN